MPAQKKIPQTNAIFARLSEINPQADGCDKMLRLSLDAKTSVKVGAYSRKGKSRVLRKAQDHDFRAKEILTPYGLLLPRYDDLWLYFTTSRVTSDFMVDVLERWWMGTKDMVKNSFPICSGRFSRIPERSGSNRETIVDHILTTR